MTFTLICQKSFSGHKNYILLLFNDYSDFIKVKSSRKENMVKFDERDKLGEKENNYTLSNFLNQT